MSKMNLRWIQRLSNFSRALIQLENAVNLSKERELTDLEKQGLIQTFEFTHELYWNVIKDYLTYLGGTEVITGSRDATREAFNRGLLENGEAWMEMIISRNKTSHTYDLKVADDIVEKILNPYFPLLKVFTQLWKKFPKMINNKFGLSENSLKSILSVLSINTKIKSARIYGSRAMGNCREGSDIDLVLIGDELSTTDLLKIENDLDDLFLP